MTGDFDYVVEVKTRKATNFLGIEKWYKIKQQQQQKDLNIKLIEWKRSNTIEG